MPPVDKPVATGLRQKLDESLAAAAADFRAKTKHDLDTPPPAIQDVVDQLAARYDPSDKEDRESKKRALENVEIALNCLVAAAKVGLKIASAASMSYPPADFCVNAVAYLVNIPGKIVRFYTRFAELFQEITFFLRQFKTYEAIDDAGQMPEELLESTNDLICGFVKICAIAYKPIKDGKLKRIFRVSRFAFLDDDSGLQDALDEFAKLVGRQDTLVGAKTLEVVLRNDYKFAILLDNQAQDCQDLMQIRSGIRGLQDDSTRRKEDQARREDFENLCKKFGVSREYAIKAPEDKLELISKNILSRTGSWLKEHDDYIRWLDFESSADPILYLYGDSGTGKTSLIPTILRDIADKNLIEQCAVSAIHLTVEDGSTNNDQEKGDKARSKHALSLALRSLAMQLAKKSEPYLEILSKSKTTKSHSKLSELTYEQLLDTLHLVPGRKRPDGIGTFCLIMDGVEPGEPLQELVSAVTQIKTPPSATKSSSGPTVATIRLMLIGKDRILPFSKNKLPPSLARIGVQSSEGQSRSLNAYDIDRYVRREVEGDTTLKSIEEMHHEFFESLYPDIVRIACGSFSVVDNKLGLIRDEIDNHLQDIKELRVIVETDPGLEKGILCANILKDLETNLDRKDIEQINEVLKWIVWGYVNLSLKQLDAIVNMKSSIKTLQQFSSKVKNKKRFQRLFKMVGGLSNPQMRIHENLLENIQSMRWSKLDGANPNISDESTISLEMHIKLNNATHADVRRFFWDLSEKASFQRFDFEGKHAVTNTKSRIHVNVVEASADILLTILDLLNGDLVCDDLTLFRQEALRLPLYVRRCYRNEKQLQERETPLSFPKKDAIISRLMQFFMNPEKAADHFKSWFTVFYDLRSMWIFNETINVAMNSWISLDTIPITLVKNPAQTVRFFADNPGNCGFLKPLTVKIAFQWLINNEWGIRECFEWIDGFLRLKEYYRRRLKSDDHTSNTNATEPTTWPNVDIRKPVSVGKRILMAAEWTKNELNNYEPDRMWYKRLGETFHQYKLYKKAARYFRFALRHPGTDELEIYKLLAFAYHDDRDLRRAIRHMKLMVQLCETRKDDDDKARVTASQDGLRNMAAWYAKLGKPHQTFACYDKINSRGKLDYSACSDFLRDAKLLQQTTRAQEMFRKMINDSESEDTNGLVRFLLRLALGPENDSDSLDKVSDVCHMASLCGHIDDVRDALRVALEIAPRSSSLQRAVLLVAMGATRLYQDRTGNEDIALSLWEEARKELANLDPTDSLRLKHHIERQCAAFHYARGMKTGFPSKQVERRLQDIHETSALYRRPMFSATPLVYYYCLVDRTEEARKLMRNEMRTAVTLLTDETPENDWDGYRRMARILLATKDPCNALAAFSLIKPYKKSSNGYDSNSDSTDQSTGYHTNSEDDEEVFSRGAVSDSETESDDNDGGNIKRASSDGPGTNFTMRKDRSVNGSEKPLKGPYCASCDGGCGISWTFASNFWVCEVCPNTNFCLSCYEAFHTGCYNSLICHPEHSWIYVPPWSADEDRTVGQGNVRIPTETGIDQLSNEVDEVSGVRKGEILPISDWLNRIRDEWGIPRPEPPPPPPSTEAKANGDGEGKESQQAGEGGQKSLHGDSAKAPEIKAPPLGRRKPALTFPK